MFYVKKAHECTHLGAGETGVLNNYQFSYLFPYLFTDSTYIYVFYPLWMDSQMSHVLSVTFQ